MPRFPKSILMVFALSCVFRAAGGVPDQPGRPVAGAAPAAAPALSFPTPTPEPGVYVHAGKRFIIRFPNTWQMIRAINDRSRAVYYFTPETGQSDYRQLKTTLAVSIIPVPDASALVGLDAVGVLQHFLPLIRTAEPGLAPVGQVTKVKLGALDAGAITFQGTVKDRPGDYTQEAFTAESDGVIFLVRAQAPKDQFTALWPIFLKIVQESEFGRPRASRAEKSLEARQIVDRYKASVVSIDAKSAKEAATGSGFIIRKDGYVLTNWHVIWDAKTNKPHEQFYVEWDDGLGRRKTPAQLIAFRRKPSPFAFFWGVDVALLKIPAGDYEPMPLTPLGEVGPGDPIVTLGFPSRSLIEGVSLTVSTGVVTRFNREPGGKVASVLTDAVSTHGSSGGPCVSLVTGGVIGLNTYGHDVTVDPHSTQWNDLLGYHGVVPIDACLSEFALITDLGVGPDGAPLDFFDSYALAGFLLARHATGDAGRLAARAATLNPGSADAHCVLALCKAQSVDEAQQAGTAPASYQEAIDQYQKALACDPAHENALVALARLQLRLGRAAEAAALADRAVQVHPDRWQPYLVRAEICFALKQFAPALQYLDRAKPLSGGVLPDPYLLAGKTNYALNNLEAGRKEYADAVRIHPANLEARLGVAQYQELRRDTQAAVTEYNAILEDFRDNPHVLYRIAECYYNSAQYTKALAPALSSENRFAKLGLTPPADLFFQIAKMQTDIKKEDSVVTTYATYLNYYKKSDVADQVHMRLADLHAAKKRLGLATAHLQEARALRNSPEVNQMLGRIPATALSRTEIKALVQLNYPAPVASDLIAAARRLDFTLRSDDEAARLTKEDGLPPAYVQAILLAQKRLTGTGPVVNPLPVNPPPVTPPPVTPPPVTPPVTTLPPVTIQPANGLVGTWTAQGRTNEGAAWQFSLQFGPNGRYQSTNVANGQVTQTVQGTYTADGQTLTGRSDAGRTFTYSYRIQGNTLTVNIPEQGGNFVFTRQ